jgi:hypothetical protein
MAIEVYEGQYSGAEIDAAVGEVNTITVLIPSGASSSNQLATASDVSTVSGSVSAIEAVIPSTATSSNKLATMADLPSGGIAGVQINSTDLTPDANDKVNIPLATASDPGVIRASYNYAFGMSDNGELLALGAGDDWNYNALSANAVISKDTLDFKLGGITDLIPSTASTSNLLATASDVSTVSGNVSAIEAKIPSGASASNQMATASDITSINDKIPSGASSSNKLATASDITGITDKIPSGASSSNQLATASDITGITQLIPSGATTSNQLATASDITGITQLIPSTATTSNKLATMSDIPSGGGIAGVQINGTDLTPDANDKVNIPMSSTSALGVIKTSDTYKTEIATTKEYYYYFIEAETEEVRILSDSDTVNIHSNNDAGTQACFDNDFEDVIGNTTVGQITDYVQGKYGYYNMNDSCIYTVLRGTISGPATGELCASTVTYANYASTDNAAFIGKGTLDNVLTGKNINDVSDETWTFTVDDGQGGTTTVTKTIKVGTTPAQVGE